MIDSDGTSFLTELLSSNIRIPIFGIEEAAHHFGLHVSPATYSSFETIPWGIDDLNRVAETHLLVAVLPISIIRIRERLRSLRRSPLLYGHETVQYYHDNFARAPGTAGWHLVRQNPLPGSYERKFGEPISAPDLDEQIPSAQVVVYSAIGYCLQTGRRIFGKDFGACNETNSQGRRVVVGNFDKHGLCIGGHEESKPNPTVGLATEYKPHPS